MIVLALDVCMAACSVALCADDVLLAAASEPMVRGHQERLAPMVRDVMRSAGAHLAQVDRIGVTMGPGSFTGLRVGLAFAKGLSLSLDRPWVGVGALRALAVTTGVSGLIVSVVGASGGRICWQVFVAGRPRSEILIAPREAAACLIGEYGDDEPWTLVGPGAHLLFPLAPGATAIDLLFPSPLAVALLALSPEAAPAKPYYLRPPTGERA